MLSLSAQNPSYAPNKKLRPEAKMQLECLINSQPASQPPVQAAAQPASQSAPAGQPFSQPANQLAPASQTASQPPSHSILILCHRLKMMLNWLRAKSFEMGLVPVRGNPSQLKPARLSQTHPFNFSQG